MKTEQINNPSIKIEEFLDFVSDSRSKFNIANQVLTESDNEIQDILHAIEFGNLTYQQNAKLAKRLKMARSERRKAKNEIEMLCPIVTWSDACKKELDGIKKLLGDARKIESNLQRRVYVQRTDVVKEVIGIDRCDGCV